MPTGLVNRSPWKRSCAGHAAGRVSSWARRTTRNIRNHRNNPHTRNHRNNPHIRHHLSARNHRNHRNHLRHRNHLSTRSWVPITVPTG